MKTLAVNSNAARLGVEGIICQLWTIEQELEARKLLARWVEREGKSGPRHRQSRSGMLNQIRVKGLAWAEIATA